MKNIIVIMVLSSMAFVTSAQNLTSFRWQNTSAGSVTDNGGNNIDGGVALYYLTDDSTIDFNASALLSESYSDDFLYDVQETGSGAFTGRLPGSYVTETDSGNNYQGYQSYLIVLDMDYDSFTSVGNVSTGTYYWIGSLSAELVDPDPPNTPQDFNPGSIQTSTQVVPEPATALLLVLGGGLAWLIRLKQRLI